MERNGRGERRKERRRTLKEGKDGRVRVRRGGAWVRGKEEGRRRGRRSERRRDCRQGASTESRGAESGKGGGAESSERGGEVGTESDEGGERGRGGRRAGFRRV
eukprot:3145541-Rhodomonas_salina.1